MLLGDTVYMLTQDQVLQALSPRAADGRCEFANCDRVGTIVPVSTATKGTLFALS